MGRIIIPKLYIMFFLCFLLAGLTGCVDTVESRKEKVNDSIEKVLTTFDVAYELEIKSNKQNDFVTDKGKETYYHFNSYVEIFDDSLSDQAIFDIIKAVDNINISYTSIYRFYQINGNSYYISDDYILIKGRNYDIVYTPIAQKQGKNLTYSEKQAICNWLESKYNLYDLYDGGYSGDKYSDELFDMASQFFNISVEDLEIIWMKRYTD